MADAAWDAWKWLSDWNKEWPEGENEKYYVFNRLSAIESALRERDELRKLRDDAGDSPAARGTLAGIALVESRLVEALRERDDQAKRLALAFEKHTKDHQRIEELTRERDKLRENVAGVEREIRLAALLSKPPEQNQQLLSIWQARLRAALGEGGDA